ncbi:hypothetical protein K2173_001824 [Erythroxylum novogranatense]|uniref:Uncharacterized protein n=1 Tax=Erythroxylum novogranatense TaxID=1862640 RepID=A0AAV8S624_9ROSI|nr:hypothetical protein K2173_001824 [Erythroxylum novogranatense]
MHLRYLVSEPWCLIYEPLPISDTNLTELTSGAEEAFGTSTAASALQLQESVPIESATCQAETIFTLSKSYAYEYRYARERGVQIISFRRTSSSF